MKPLFLKVSSQPQSSFAVKREMAPNINSRWHYHPEIELIHFTHGAGMQFVGDSMRPFHAGDVVLIGANLPHYWRFDSYASRKNNTYSTVIHFIEDFWGEQFTALSEIQKIKTVIDKSCRGILLRGKSADQVARSIDRVYKRQGLPKLIALLETLYAFADSKEQQVLSSVGFEYAPSTVSDTRIRNVYEFTWQHLHKKIDLKSVASIAGLTENSFCRFFKSSTGKTYFQYLAEARVGQACKLLMEDKMSVKEVCFNSGFDNFSCFFGKFKSITGKTPLRYKREII